MNRLSPIALTCVWAVALGGGLVLVVELPGLHDKNLPMFVVFLALSWATSFLQLGLPLEGTRASSLSVSWAVDLAALVVLGLEPALVIAAMSAWSQRVFEGRTAGPVRVTLFTMGTLVLAVKAAAVVYGILGGLPASLPADLTTYAGAIAGAGFAQLLVNTLLPSAAVALTMRQPFYRRWHDRICWSAPSYLLAAALSATSAWFLLQSHHALALLALAPIYLLDRVSRLYLGRMAEAQRQTDDVADLHLATIEALALAIDAKDHRTQTHLHRLALFAEGLGRACGLTDMEVQGLKTAAVLHDIGQLAVPEHILSKPGPLTQEEFQRVHIHPQVGADIIRRVPFPYPVAPLIASHHERWDGRGYPAGLLNENIPLGARILTVVDYYDALVSDRPYHKAHTRDAAIALLRQEAGRALDPNVVRTFLDILPELEASGLSARMLTASPIEVSPVEGAPRKGATPSAFDHIARAHREIYALYEVAQTLGASLSVAETMQEVSGKLMNLVPFSACALFLHAEAKQSLICRFASGIDARILERLTIPIGQGVNGAVARTRVPIVNGRAADDIEAAGSSAATSLQSATVCPLVANDRLIGTLAVYHVTPEFYSDDDRRLLDRVAEQAASVIFNSMVFEQTQEDSLTDPLTGLPNTRSMFLQISRELARANRLQSNVSLLVMDLDNFKEINDTYGHGVGDRALRDAAAVLKAALRPYDSCGRYAGDEFIVVLPGCEREDAESKRSELQHALDALVIETPEGQSFRLAISAGAATYPVDGTCDETLLAAADKRMYDDKAARKIRWRRESSDGFAHSPDAAV